MNIFKRLYCLIYGHKIDYEAKTPTLGCYCSNGCGKYITPEEIAKELKRIWQKN